jgi:glutathione S-transferase
MAALPAALRTPQASRPTAAAPRPRRLAARAAAFSAPPPPKFAKPTLFDIPISNCSARIRCLIYSLGLEDEIAIAAPATLGGVKSEEYRGFVNPLGKMPALALPRGAPLFESAVIEGYLLDLHGAGSALVPASPAGRARAALAARIHDVEIVPVQGAMYKPMEAAERLAKLAQIAGALDALEWHLNQSSFGPLTGDDGAASWADGALAPTFVFLTRILPRHFGWRSVFTGRPRLEAWWAAAQREAPIARVVAEMDAALAGWEEAKRWETTGVAAQVADAAVDWTLGN